MMDGAGPIERLRLRIRGRVQGVGFRPFLWTLARAHGLSGFARNDAEGVWAEVEGAGARAFLAALPAQAPALARIDTIEVHDISPVGGTGFEIAASAPGGGGAPAIPPDTALCADCLAELFSATDRRSGHPFITCTNCGPRYTIAYGLPYDRAATSMAGFAMCPACAAEYADPADRRFHAQPVACPDCGPRLDMAAGEIVARLKAGQIVAIKGLGGFHIAADARNADAVARLRGAKRRPAKPFAVMVLNSASADTLAYVSAREAAVMARPERPVVVVAGRGGLPAAVSGGLPTLGLMLPSTPLHYLLFHAAARAPEGTGWLDAVHPLALIMTSANLSGEPLITGEAEAAVKLDGLADAVAGHDRAIVTRCDDSVARVVDGAPLLLRRARGHVPDPIALAETGPAVLGLGALLKVAPCLIDRDRALMGQHVGDVENAATAAFLRETAAHLTRLTGVTPRAVACDAHADYPTSRIAREMGLPVIAVHHHHAHLAAVAAEYGITGALAGLVLDGFGLGPDGTLWGGEYLEIDGTRCTRLGHLRALPLPGGDRAARAPWRMAAAALHALGRGGEIANRFDLPDAGRVSAMLAAGLNCPPTTALGRLFDAAAGLLGVRTENRFEAEAAMALEALCERPEVLPGGWRIGGGAGGGVLDFTPLLAALADCRDPARGSALFHGTLAAGLAELVLTRLPGGAGRVALTGGCVANAALTGALAARLRAAGLIPLIPRAVPPGDGGLALGQALIARRIMKETG